MNNRERMLSASRGESVDRKPIVVWSESPGHQADAVIVSHLSIEDAIRTHPDQMVLAELVSPFGRAMRAGVDLLEILRDDPERGRHELAVLTNEVRNQIQHCLDSGAAGIFYRLDGAYAAAASPMEYGGHFLEIDRAILAEFLDGHLNILYVEGEEEVYYDCVADLPAQVFAWHSEASGATVEEMRKLRPGALAAPSQDADIILVKHYDDA